MPAGSLPGSTIYHRMVRANLPPTEQPANRSGPFLARLCLSVRVLSRKAGFAPASCRLVTDRESELPFSVALEPAPPRVPRGLLCGCANFNSCKVPVALPFGLHFLRPVPFPRPHPGVQDARPASTPDDARCMATLLPWRGGAHASQRSGPPGVRARNPSKRCDRSIRPGARQAHLPLADGRGRNVQRPGGRLELRCERQGATKRTSLLPSYSPPIVRTPGIPSVGFVRRLPLHSHVY